MKIISENQFSGKTYFYTIAPELEGDICGTFGIGLLSYENDLEGAEKEQSICHASRVTTVPIQSFVEFGLWTVGGTDFSATCYMWVSSANAHTRLPQVIQREHEALLESLINGSSRTHPAELTATGGSPLHISPVIAYTIEINDTDVPLCLNAEEPCVVLEEFVPRQDCTFGLMCPVLEGNVCGSYGVTLSTSTADGDVQDVCHDGELYTGSVDHHLFTFHNTFHNEDGVELKLWYTNGAKFRAECFFWCTEDGSIPKKKVQNFDISELLSGEFRVSPIKMGTNDSSQPHSISPLTVYFTNQTLQDNGYCDADLCRQKNRFEWHGRSDCQSNFVCTRLDGNVCGDFGVTLSYGLTGAELTSREDTEVCQERYSYKGAVSDGHSLEIQLWYRRGTEFQAECFMWCTAEGGLPDVPAQVIDVDAVISDESQLEKISLIANPETVAISPNIIYEFELGPQSNASDHVVSFYRFRRRGPEQCEATLVCPELTGNVCGSYELAVSYGKPEHSKMPVCHRAQYYSGVVEPGQDILIEFWHHKDEGKVFRAKCFIWCTSHIDGEPPVNPPESAVPLELTSARAQDSVNVVPVDTNRIFISTNNIYSVSVARDSCDSQLPYCEIKQRFSLNDRTDSGSGTCEFRFFCDSFGDGEPCADFGIKIGGEDVCHEDQLVGGNLTSGGHLEVDIWHADRVEAKCFLWCTVDGRLPVAEEDASDGFEELHDTIAGLLNNSRVVEKVDLTPSSEPHPINLSPYAVYSIETESSEGDTEDDSNVAFQGKWARAEDRCHAHLVCPALEGNSCGDFGIGIEFGNGSKEDVCWTMRSYRGEVGMGQTVTLELWRMPEAKYKVECYFWCTLDGKVPGSPRDNAFRQDDIAKLINLTTGLTPINVTSADDQKKQYVSPVTIYQLDLNQGDLQPCTRQNSTSPPCAATSAHYVWSPKNTMGGKYGFGCSELAGNACGDFGIVISVADDANKTIDNVDNVCKAYFYLSLSALMS